MRSLGSQRLHPGIGFSQMAWLVFGGDLNRAKTVNANSVELT